jgi:glutamine phosphoribosylpyrophosphate amidotransferase
MSLLAFLAERPCSMAPWLGSRIAFSTSGIDAWGVAAYAVDRTWNSQRFVGSAAGHGVLASANASLIGLVAQGHMRTVGEAALARTPPFRRGRWVFAHTGPLEDIELVRSRASAERRRQCGSVDSELLFAFILTRLDERDLTERHAPDQLDKAMLESCAELNRDFIGSSSFVLSDGETLYAYRRGRPLHVMECRPGDGEGLAVVVSSSNITTGPWPFLDEGTLLRCRRSHGFEVRVLSGADPRRAPTSDVELPFTD